MRICFAGTPQFAAEHLQALIDSQHELVAVYTQPDRRSGRGKKLLASPVKQLAMANELRLLQPASLKTEEQEELLRELNVDALIVVAYGLILPQSILDIPLMGCINVHASLLPRWRGAAPIERALLSGDAQTGVTLMQMDAGLDTGDMLLSVPVTISDTDTREDLEKKLSVAGAAALISLLDRLPALQLTAVKQDNALSTYAEKVHKSEAEIDWNCSALEINRQVRAGIGRFPAYCFAGKDRLRVLTCKASAGTQGDVEPGTILSTSNEGILVQCLDSTLLIEQLQFPGKNSMRASDALNSRKEQLGIGASLRARPSSED